MNTPLASAFERVTEDLRSLRAAVETQTMFMALLPIVAIGEKGPFVLHASVVEIIQKLKGVSDGVVRPAFFIGVAGVRDPEHPCGEFSPGTPTNGGCEGDGHYLCQRCVLHAEAKSS